ncbi:MAG: 4a-hydroxytetrahydrobiopterin dehydratase [Ignavibacteriales bacterium]|nr:4a-hydroxytetrahydrobiopterin dehydratase [Ignavibacteriales bacterium]
MSRILLHEDQIPIELKQLDGWSLAGNEIRRTWEFEDFVRAIQFVNSVALIAEKFNHHPDIDIRWNRVHLTLSTHSAGGLTLLDFTLAKAIDEL